MTPLMEKLEDGRMLFNNDGVRDYLTEFMCDAAAEATTTDHECPIMLMLTNAADCIARDAMVVNMVDSFFNRSGEPCIQALSVIYRAVFGMQLEETGDYIYATRIEGDE